MRFVAEALNVLHAESLADGQKFENVLTHKFSCECNAEKQKWIMAVDCFAESTLKQIAKAEAKAKAGSAQDGTGPGTVNLEPSATGEGDRGDEVGSNKSSSSGTSAEKTESSSAEAGSDSAPMSPMSVSSAEGALSEQEPACLFRDIQDMGKPVADCVVHNQPCPVPTVDLLVIGTSCKDMSKANPSAPKGLVLKEQSSRGGSAQTFRGFLSYLERCHPSLILFENVDSMAEESKGSGETNLDVFWAETASRGYECQVVMTDAGEFGLPCRRRRIYVLLVKTSNNALLDFAGRPLAGMFATFGALLNGCLRSPPCARLLWLPSEDPAVLQELHLREEKRENERIKKEKEAQKESKSKEKAPSPTGGAWVDAHMAFAQNLKRRWGMAAPAHLQSNRWFQVLTTREQDALPHLQAENPNGTVFRDLSQSITRANANSFDSDRGIHIAPTILPRQQLWMECDEAEDCRLMLGRESLLYQGFPSLPFLRVLHEDILRTFAEKSGQSGPPAASYLQTRSAQGSQGPHTPWVPSESLMQDLAGNAMALPVLLCLAQCAFTALSWRPTVSAIASHQVLILVNIWHIG